VVSIRKLATLISDFKFQIADLENQKRWGDGRGGDKRILECGVRLPVAGIAHRIFLDFTKLPQKLKLICDERGRIAFYDC
jgi:hypothetical protein